MSAESVSLDGAPTAENPLLPTHLPENGGDAQLRHRDTATGASKHSLKSSNCDLNPSKQCMSGAEPSGSRVGLKKEISLLSATSIIAGVVIGSGIFVSPVSITENCGSIGLSLIMWAVSGVMVMLIALCYTELAAMFPESGAEYAFYKNVLGPLPAFLLAWAMIVIVNPAIYAVLSMTTAIYLVKPFFPDCDPPHILISLGSVWILVTLAFLNCVYVRYVTRLQTVLAAAKILALIVIIGTAAVHIGFGKTELLQKPFEGTTTDPGNIAVAVYSGLFTYTGWQYIFMLLEEVKNPYRNVPRATVISFLVIISLYILTNVAYFTILSTEEMFQSEAVALSFAQRTLGKFSVVMPLFVACSTIGALNGALLGGSRIYFVAARDKMLPAALAMISSKFNTPLPSVVVTCVISVVYVWLGDPVSLIEYLGFVVNLTYIVSLATSLYLKKTQPDRDRPINVPAVLVGFLLVLLIGLFGLGLYKNPYKYGIALLLVICGVPLYLVGVVWSNKPRILVRPVEKVTQVVQKLAMVVTQEQD